MDQHKSPKFWEALRLPCLAMVFGGTATALGVGVQTPLQPRPAIATYIFPASIPLSGWQSVERTPIPLPEDKKLAPPDGQVYRYKRSWQTLTIEARYLTATKADVSQFIRWYTDIPETAKAEVHHQKGKGSFILLTYQDKTYLSSCINAQGVGTATGREYMQSQILSSLNPARFAAWLVGRQTLFDQRCLWFYIYLPEQTYSQQTRQTLEQAWGSWHEYWQNHFPPVR